MAENDAPNLARNKWHINVHTYFGSDSPVDPGHMFISVTDKKGRVVFCGGLGAASRGAGNAVTALGVDLAGKVRPDASHLTAKNVYTRSIPVDEGTALEAMDYAAGAKGKQLWDSIERKQGSKEPDEVPYNLLYNNCTTFVKNMLKDVGVGKKVTDELFPTENMRWPLNKLPDSPTFATMYGKMSKGLPANMSITEQEWEDLQHGVLTKYGSQLQRTHHQMKLHHEMLDRTMPESTGDQRRLKRGVLRGRSVEGTHMRRKLLGYVREGEHSEEDAAERRRLVEIVERERARALREKRAAPPSSVSFSDPSNPSGGSKVMGHSSGSGSVGISGKDGSGSVPYKDEAPTVTHRGWRKTKDGWRQL